MHSVRRPSGCVRHARGAGAELHGPLPRDGTGEERSAAQLTLVPATNTQLRAALQGVRRFPARSASACPETWPHDLDDAALVYARTPRGRPREPRWWFHFSSCMPRSARLVGSGGFKGARPTRAARSRSAEMASSRTAAAAGTRRGSPASSPRARSRTRASPASSPRRCPSSSVWIGARRTASRASKACSEPGRDPLRARKRAAGAPETEPADMTTHVASAASTSARRSASVMSELRRRSRRSASSVRTLLCERQRSSTRSRRTRTRRGSPLGSTRSSASRSQSSFPRPSFDVLLRRTRSGLEDDASRRSSSCSPEGGREGALVPPVDRSFGCANAWRSVRARPTSTARTGSSRRALKSVDRAVCDRGTARNVATPRSSPRSPPSDASAAARLRRRAPSPDSCTTRNEGGSGGNATRGSATSYGVLVPSPSRRSRSHDEERAAPAPTTAAIARRTSPLARGRERLVEERGAPRIHACRRRARRPGATSPRRPSAACRARLREARALREDGVSDAAARRRAPRRAGDARASRRARPGAAPAAVAFRRERHPIS